MNPFLIRNAAPNAAEQRRIGAVKAAAENLAQAISNAIRPDLSKVAEIKTAITNEYQRCENLRKPVTNARDRSHLVPKDDLTSVTNGSTLPGADRAHLAPKGE